MRKDEETISELLPPPGEGRGEGNGVHPAESYLGALPPDRQVRFRRMNPKWQYLLAIPLTLTLSRRERESTPWRSEIVSRDEGLKAV
jgi:hypothetical protein